METRTLSTQQYIALPGERVLAYSDSGDRSSSNVILFFHDALSLGTARRLLPALTDKGVHYIAPTSPGWGQTSPADRNIPYHLTIISDITILLKHLHPDVKNLTIYLFGNGFGGIHAQILFGAPFDIFPYGCRIAGCFLVSSFSPFKLHHEYTQAMTTLHSFIIGPLSQAIPFRLGSRLGAFIGSLAYNSIDRQETRIRRSFFNTMGAEGLVAFKEWREETGTAEGELERRMAETAVKSVEHSWEGFLGVPDVVNGDWGFIPSKLEEKHYLHRPIFIVASETVNVERVEMAKWLATNYKNSHLRLITGGRFQTLFSLNELWKQFFELCD